MSAISYLPDNLRLIASCWNISQDELGNKFLLNRGVMSTYVLEKSQPSVKMMIELENITGISVKDLYYRKIEKEELPERPLKEPRVFQNEIKEPEIEYGRKLSLEARMDAIEKRLIFLEVKK